MNLFMKSMLAALALAIMLPFTLLKDEQGKTLMSFSDVSLPEFDMPGLPDMSPAGELVPSGGAAGGVDRFYKWYDADGNVQFTTEAPPDGVKYTVKEFDPDANVIQAVKLPVQEPAVEIPGSNTRAHDPADESPAGLSSPYSKEGIEKLFEDTKNIQNLLDQRFDNQNAAVNQ